MLVGIGGEGNRFFREAFLNVLNTTSCRQGWTRAREIVGDDKHLTLLAMSHLGRALLEQGGLTEGEQVLREALAGLRRLLGDRALFTLQCMTRLTNMLLASTKVGEAEMMLRKYVATAGETLPSASWKVATARSLLGACHTARGDFEDAERLLLETYPIMSRNLGQKQEMTQQAIQRIVKLYDAWDKPEQASEWRAKLAVERGH